MSQPMQPQLERATARATPACAHDQLVVLTAATAIWLGALTDLGHGHLRGGLAQYWEALP
jgi:hypothetical protein